MILDLIFWKENMDKYNCKIMFLWQIVDILEFFNVDQMIDG